MTLLVLDKKPLFCLVQFYDSSHPTSRGRCQRVMLFTNVLIQNDLQTSSSRVGTRVTNLVTHKINHCINHSSLSLSLYIYIYTYWFLGLINFHWLFNARIFLTHITAVQKSPFPLRFKTQLPKFRFYCFLKIFSEIISSVKVTLSQLPPYHVPSLSLHFYFTTMKFYETTQMYFILDLISGSRW